LLFFYYFGSILSLASLLSSKAIGSKTVVVTDFSENSVPNLKTLHPLRFMKECLRYLLFLLQIFLADSLICFTEYEHELLVNTFQLKKIIGRKITIIPLGHNFEIKKSPKENFILSVGWWCDRKNLHTTLNVFSKLLKENSDLKLVIAGDFLEGSYYIPEEKRWESGKEYRKKIEKLIKELSLERHIEFIGAKSRDELHELYRKSKIFYLPSKNETFGMVYVEAMASGTPIVAMKNSAVQYVVKDGVTGFLRNDEEGQKEAILRLLTDEKLYNEVQKNCLKEAEKYKWENVAKKWEKLIEELVGNMGDSK